MMEDEGSWRTANLTIAIFLAKLEGKYMEAREEIIKVEKIKKVMNSFSKSGKGNFYRKFIEINSN